MYSHLRRITVFIQPSVKSQIQSYQQNTDHNMQMMFCACKYVSQVGSGEMFSKDRKKRNKKHQKKAPDLKSLDKDFCDEKKNHESPKSYQLIFAERITSYLYERLKSDGKEIGTKKYKISRITKAKLDYLNSIGFNDNDIYNNTRICRVSLRAIKTAYDELTQNDIEGITLGNLISYINSHKLKRRRKRKITLARYFHWNVDEIQIPHVVLDSLLSRDKLLLKQNYEYLRSENFTDEDLVKMPLVLGHNHNVLKRHWNMVECHNNLLWCTKNKQKTLNLLQYHIEKENNFRFPVVDFDVEIE